eukprot:3087796-Amphidinium_carterae.1
MACRVPCEARQINHIKAIGSNPLSQTYCQACGHVSASASRTASCKRAETKLIPSSSAQHEHEKLQ